MLGDNDLYDLVSSYSAFGNHHTGTDVDHQTTDWLSGVLRDMGATVRHEPYEFTRWIGATTMTLTDGTPVPHVPVFYSAAGSVSTTSLDVIEVDRSVASGATGLEVFLDGVTDDEAMVFALNGPDDLPVQCNRVPELRDGPPAVIIAGNWAQRVREGARLTFDAHTAPAQSANLHARMGQPSKPEVIVTTPLSGWTAAAGERGTGLAVALAMIEDLAADHDVVLVAATCHELDHYGLNNWLANRTIDEKRAIHLGSSVGATNSGGALARRLALTTATGDKRHAIGELVTAANWQLSDTRIWLGEGGNWRAAGAEVLSFLGSTALFHTTGDTPTAATNPAALGLASRTAIAAARRFLQAA